MKSNTYVDGDSLVFKCAYGKVARSIMADRWKKAVAVIKANTFADEVKIALRGKDNFRPLIYPEYKAHRPKIDERVQEDLTWMNEYAMENGAYASDGWEADDQVCAWAYEADKQGEQYVIAGIDKDLLQYPGNHYNYGGTAKKPIPDEERWTFVSPEEGLFTMFCQFLTGDASDNIIGLKGIGPVKAKKALMDKSVKEQMQTICDMYEKETGNGWDKRLWVNTNLIYMRRFKEDVFEYTEYLK